MTTNNIKDDQHFLNKVTEEAKLTSFPPKFCIVLLAVFGLLSVSLIETAVHFNSMNMYLITATSFIPLGIISAISFLHIARKWGREKLSTLLGLSLDKDSETAINSWCISYTHLDRSALNAVEPRVFKILLDIIDDLEITDKMRIPFGHEIYRNWKNSERVEICDKLLTLYSKHGNLKDYNGLKLCTNNFKCDFKNNSQLTLKVQKKRDQIIEDWKNTLA